MTVSDGIKRDCRCPKANHQHVTRRAYERDHCHCLLCRAAHANSTRVYRNGGRWNENGVIDATGSKRRLQALAAIGVPTKLVAEHIGCSTDMISYLRAGKHPNITPVLAGRVAAAYQALWDKPSGDANARRMIALARNAGYVPPMAWDDIDDPHETPKGSVHIINPARHKDTDEIAVQEAISGRRVHLTKQEQSVAVAKLTNMGYSIKDIGVRLRLSGRQVQRIRASKAGELAA